MFKINQLKNSLPTDGYIEVLNYGAFLAEFLVFYKLDGQYFSRDSGSIVVTTSRRIVIPKDATSIDLFIKIDLFIRNWTTIYKRSFNSSDEYCFLTYGVTAAPFVKQIPCTSPGFNKYIKYY